MRVTQLQLPFNHLSCHRWRVRGYGEETVGSTGPLYTATIECGHDSTALFHELMKMFFVKLLF